MLQYSFNWPGLRSIPLQEPALNPALEEQAIGRAWRMGQKRAVTVKASWNGARGCMD